METTTTAPLPDHYWATDGGRVWNLYCRVCGKGWTLLKSDKSPGNVLRLLDHARGHDEKEGGIDNGGRVLHS